jgi:hypothetical protein
MLSLRKKKKFLLSPVKLIGVVLTNRQCAANVTVPFIMHQSLILRRHMYILTNWHQCIGAATIDKSGKSKY